MDAFVFPVNLCIENMHTVFTDGSSNRKATCVIGSHVYSLEFPPASAQIIELCAVAAAFEMLKKQTFNLYTDSLYIYTYLYIYIIVYSYMKLFLF
jgi:ribonuclease HI